MAKDIYGRYVPDGAYISHYGIKGQKWGVRNGPPYPLSRSSSGGGHVKRTSVKDGGSISKSNRKKKRVLTKAQRTALGIGIGAAALAPSAAYMYKVYKNSNKGTRRQLRKAFAKSAAIGGGALAARELLKRRKNKQKDGAASNANKENKPLTKEEALRRGTPKDVSRYMPDITPEEYKEVLQRFRNENELQRYMNNNDIKQHLFRNISATIIASATTAQAMEKMSKYIKLVRRRKLLGLPGK